VQEANSGHQCAILPSTRMEPCLYFVLLKHILSPAEAALMRAGVCPLKALTCCENLTEDCREN